MKRKYIFATAVAILSLIIFWSIGKNTINGNLVGPGLMQSSAAPTPVPTPNAPKTFNFDSSTDLQGELEKVNPQVLDSDFE